MTGKRKTRSDDDPPTTPSAQAMELAAMVDYAAGGIVSRIIAETPGGTVTLFAFDAGQGLSEHSSPFDALVQVVEGQADLTIGGRDVAASQGHLIVMPADVPHAVRAPRRMKMLLTMLQQD